jgi:hypothetical protein
MDLQDIENIDLAIDELQSLLYTSATQSCTLKHSNSAKSWWNPELESLQMLMKSARRQHAKHKTASNKQKFLHSRQTFTRALRKAKQNIFKQRIEEADNPWKLYRLLGKKRAPKEHIKLSDEHGNPIVIDSNLNAETLLKRFFPDEDISKDTQQHNDIRTKVNNFLQNTTGSNSVPKLSVDEIKAAFSSQTPFGSPGVDGLFPALIQWALDSLASPLTNLFQSCMAIAYFPDAWKKGQLLTIPKPNHPDKTSYKSQRPITLLPIIGKGFEKVLLERFLFLSPQTRNWFHDSQFGFRANHSTDLALLALQSHIEKMNALGSATALLKLDIQSAFDMAWHPAIINNLIDKGLPATYIHIVNSYLSNRLISVSYGGALLPKNLPSPLPKEPYYLLSYGTFSSTLC